MSTDQPIYDFNHKILYEDDIDDCVRELRKLVFDDDKLKRFRTDDAYLLRFLHCTDFNVPIAFKRMQDFCNLLLEHPDWFASTGPLDKKTEIEKNVKAMLGERDRYGRQIFVLKIGKVDVSKTSPEEQTQIDEMWFETVMDDPETQAKGVSVILDTQGYSWKMFRWLTPKNMRLSTLKADLYPCKSVVYHVVNTSFLVKTSIKLFWPFLSIKIKEMVKFHFENWPSLHEHISPEVLPAEYGGTGPDIDFNKLNQGLFEKSWEIGRKLRYQKIA